MRTSFMAVICLGAASSAFGQIQSDTITVQATRSIQLTPDQIVFNLTVTAGANTSFDHVLTALQALGITAANLSSTSFGNQDSLEWSFSLAVPFAQMKATIASLTSLGQSISKGNSGLKLSFAAQGSTASPELMQAKPCSTDDLIADAQAQAQKMAAAAGFTVGAIVAISKQKFAAVASPALLTFSTPPVFATFTVGQFISISQYSQALFASPPPMSNCTAEVRFAMLRYR